MRYPLIGLVEGDASPDPWTLGLPPGPARAPSAIEAAVAAIAEHERLAYVWGPAGLSSEGLDLTMRLLRARGLSVGIQGLASILPTEAVLAARSRGLHRILLPFHGMDPGRHDARVGLAGDHAAARTLAEAALGAGLQVHLDVRIPADDPAALAALAPLVRRGDRTLHLHLEGAESLDQAALDQLGEALLALDPAAPDTVITDVLPGLCGLAGPEAPVPTATAWTHALLRRAIVPPSLRRGLDGAGTPAERTLASASGAPLLGAPSDRATWEPLPGPRVTVVVPAISDPVLTFSTLPGLAARLAARGARVRLETVWDAPWNLWGPGAWKDGVDPATIAPLQVERTNHRETRRFQAARSLGQAFLESLDPSGADAVIVPGYATAAQVLADPRLDPGTRVVLADFHLLDGVVPLPEDDRLVIESCFPRYAAGYLRFGVPLGRVRWRAYPLLPEHFAPGPPAASCERAFAGGNQRRDWITLARALERVDAAVDLYTRYPGPPAPGLTHQGDTNLAGLARAVAASRFVILPLESSATDAAGITLMAMALSAGRPVVATCTPAALDHLHHEVDALLVPPGDADALAEAIGRLSQDDALVARLAEGALAAGIALSVDAWAADLLDGGEQVPRWRAGSAWASW